MAGYGGVFRGLSLGFPYIWGLRGRFRAFYAGNKVRGIVNHHHKDRRLLTNPC
jgi:hypothetical protein